MTAVAEGEREAPSAGLVGPGPGLSVSGEGAPFAGAIAAALLLVTFLASIGTALIGLNEIVAEGIGTVLGAFAGHGSRTGTPALSLVVIAAFVVHAVRGRRGYSGWLVAPSRNVDVIAVAALLPGIVLWLLLQFAGELKAYYSLGWSPVVAGLVFLGVLAGPMQRPVVPSWLEPLGHVLRILLPVVVVLGIAVTAFKGAQMAAFLTATGGDVTAVVSAVVWSVLTGVTWAARTGLGLVGVPLTDLDGNSAWPSDLQQPLGLGTFSVLSQETSPWIRGALAALVILTAWVAASRLAATQGVSARSWYRLSVTVGITCAVVAALCAGGDGVVRSDAALLVGLLWGLVVGGLEHPSLHRFATGPLSLGWVRLPQALRGRRGLVTAGTLAITVWIVSTLLAYVWQDSTTSLSRTAGQLESAYRSGDSAAMSMLLKEAALVGTPTTVKVEDVQRGPDWFQGMLASQTSTYPTVNVSVMVTMDDKRGDLSIL